MLRYCRLPDGRIDRQTFDSSLSHPRATEHGQRVQRWHGVPWLSHEWATTTRGRKEAGATFSAPKSVGDVVTGLALSWCLARLAIWAAGRDGWLADGAQLPAGSQTGSSQSVEALLIKLSKPGMLIVILHPLHALPAWGQPVCHDALSLHAPFPFVA